jgi:nitrite reductase/ring-hydroxylating ferredoxin subunit/DMSO/TMAO reductase YedYZ heme-binding membrane subunit
MGHAYQAVGWNRQKRIYDLTVALSVATYLALFIGVGVGLFPDATAETLVIRALGTCAFIMLHVILCIGPLHRFFPSTAPLLYNRRHLGVSMFLVALAHASMVTLQFHSMGSLNPFVSILTEGGGPSGSVNFQLFGLLALAILFLMAATSHDFWLSRLSPGTWKRLHQSVYVAYSLLVAHVAFGIVQQESSPAWALATLAGVLTVGGLHIAAALRERKRDRAAPEASGDGFVRVCRVEDIPEGRARTVVLSGDRVAIFRYGGRVSAVSNTCRHQGGPLGEGRILNGCIVCPWHGYEYDPATGRAPAPFTEKVPTFRVRIEGGEVLVHPKPNPPGTPVEPAAANGDLPDPRMEEPA